MKIFIGGSKAIKAPQDLLCNKLNGLIAENAEILIGDCYGIDASVQKYLAGKRYPHVTVYAVNGAARNNIGNWNTYVVPGKNHIGTFQYYRQKDSTMAIEADEGFMIWDGESKGTFVNIVELLGYRKPVEVYLVGTQKAVELCSFDDLKAILPIKGESETYLTEKEKDRFLACFSCGEINQDDLWIKGLHKEKICDILCNSSLPLTEKYRWISQLAKQENLLGEIVNECKKAGDKRNAGMLAERMIEISFSYQAGQIRRALRRLKISK